MSTELQTDTNELSEPVVATSPYGDRIYILVDGERQECSREEWTRWKAGGAERLLLRTRVAAATVETVYFADEFDQCLRNYIVVDERRVPFDGGGDDPAEMHALAVRRAIKRWAALPAYPESILMAVPNGEPSLRGASFVSDLWPKEARPPFALLAATSSSPPTTRQSLRARLMRALGQRPSTWYELQGMLNCSEERALQCLELAWDDGLLVREAGLTRTDPPVFGLSEKGRALLREGRVSMYDQGCAGWQLDFHASGIDPWSIYCCPLCGAEVTACWSWKGNLKLECSRELGWLGATGKCPAKWTAVLKDGQLWWERVVITDVNLAIEVDHWKSRTVVTVAGELRSKSPRKLSRVELRDKVKTYILFS